MAGEVTGAKAFVDTLKRFGIEYIFCVPGTTLLDIYDVIREEKYPRLITARHEQAAAVMADGYARVSGKPGIVLVSRAPALCNTAIGLHGAYVESSPIIVVNGAPALGISYRDCFEDMNFADFAKPFSKWYVRIEVPSRVEELTSRAIHESLSGRKRPVVVSFPIDIQQAVVHKTKTTYMNIKPAYPCMPGSDAIPEAIQLLERAKRPVFLIGGGCRGLRNRNILVEVAEQVHAPVVTTWGRTDVFPNSHTLYTGMAGPGAFQTTKKVLKQADTVIAVGCRFSEFTTNRYTCFTDDVKLIHVDIDTTEIGKIFPADVGIHSDAAAFFDGMSSYMREQGIIFDRRPWVTEICQIFADEKRTTKEQSLEHPRMQYMQIMKKRMPEDTVFVIDCATFGPWVTRYYEFNHPNTLLISAAGCLGFGFPAGMGASLAAPGRTVVSVVGDGSFLMCLPNLATAVQEKIPLIIIVMNNFCYGNIAERQKAFFEGRIFGCELENPNFAAVAQEFGAQGYRVHNPQEFDAAVTDALKAQTPCVIDVIEEFEAGLPWGSKPLVAK